MKTTANTNKSGIARLILSRVLCPMKQYQGAIVSVRVLSYCCE